MPTKVAVMGVPLIARTPNANGSHHRHSSHSTSQARQGRAKRAKKPAPPTSDMAVALDGVFYTSVHGRLAGVDLGDGHEAVTVSHGADAAEGMVLVHGHGAVTTRDPGLVLGFD